LAPRDRRWETAGRAQREANVRIAVATLRFSVAIVCLTAAPALAGPPFVTDDPVPTDYGHFEIYAFSQGNANAGRNSGTALGLEVNYGLLPDVQISASLPVGFSASGRGRVRYGITAAEFGVKYRFVEEDESGWRPQISFYPSVDTAIGSPRGMDDNATHEFLPLWMQKSFGKWTAFGGGGYTFNPGHDSVGSWFGGAALTRQMSDRLALGVELYKETAEARCEKGIDGINLGATFDFSDKFHLVGSAGLNGHNLSSGRGYYIALEWTP
jgi:hypothetical protein